MPIRGGCRAPPLRFEPATVQVLDSACEGDGCDARSLLGPGEGEMSRDDTNLTSR